MRYIILVGSFAALKHVAICPSLYECSSVWLSNVASLSSEAGWPDLGREEIPEANWLHASLVAPTVAVTPPLLRYLPRGSLGFCSMPPFVRGRLHECEWHPGVSVVFSAAECSSHCRNGAGEKNGGGSGGQLP